MDIRGGSLRLFRIFGISVYLHWSWLLLAYFAMGRNDSYTSPMWAGLEFVTVFVIVLIHEFGHALATKSVGGQADTIMLWPLGGIAFVRPPMRPGAMLWSIFAGPMVNIILLPITYYLMRFAWNVAPGTDVAEFAFMAFAINTALLVFNMLPIYPLDGGQILQSLLWFFMGYAKSLRVASVIGLFGAAGLVALAVYISAGPLFYVMVGFIGLQAFLGYQRASILLRGGAQYEEAAYAEPEPDVEVPPARGTPERSAPPATPTQYRPPQF